jgi:hypothetical protein
MALRGVLFNGNNFICLAHDDSDIDQAIAAYDAAFRQLAGGIASGDLKSLLVSETVQPAFRAVR